MKYGKKTGLIKFDLKQVRAWRPCYDPARHLKPGVRYDAVKILKNFEIPAEDRIWLVLREDLLSEKRRLYFHNWKCMAYKVAVKNAVDTLRNPSEIGKIANQLYIKHLTKIFKAEGLERVRK